MNQNFYNTKADVIRAVVRPQEHSFWSILSMFEMQEEPSDLLGSPRRDSWWLDSQIWQRYHYHTWTISEDYIDREWTACYQGIGQCNSVLFDLDHLDPAKFGFTVAEFDAFKAQNKILKAYYHWRLLDEFRNIQLFRSMDQGQDELSRQATPVETFNYIESELKGCIEELSAKTWSGGNRTNQGQWTKAAAAALLVRLYLNAEVYIGEEHYDECAEYAQNIIDGDYGLYSLEDTWDGVFDWDNDTSEEIIFGFPSTFGGTHWHYQPPASSRASTIYWRTVPANSEPYFGSPGQLHNPKYALQPSLEVTGEPFTFTLGRPVAKFKKYPADYRLAMYRNLGNSTREGMMVFGYLEYTSAGETKRVTSATTGKVIYLRDQVGIFNDLGPGQYPVDQTVSSMADGDMNSGWHFCKYPMYRSSDAGHQEADFVLIRLAEIYYSLAECKFRDGDVNGAGKLMNEVRKRNYPAATHTAYLYAPDGSATLDDAEMLDEWGREFLAEGRRRTDLVRWGVFNTGTWWDKQPDEDDHTAIFPIPENVLRQNPRLVQNPGYPDIERN
jgi:hypothetical protein